MFTLVELLFAVHVFSHKGGFFMKFAMIKKTLISVSVCASLVFSFLGVPARADGYNQGIVTFVTSLFNA